MLCCVASKISKLEYPNCLAINPCKLPVPLPLEHCVPGPGACGNRPNMFCHIGAVPQTTVCCPAEGNPCLLPLDPGIGDARLERWFYNVELNTCQPFIYAGSFKRLKNK